jgi:hypothetical protein
MAGNHQLVRCPYAVYGHVQRVQIATRANGISAGRDRRLRSQFLPSVGRRTGVEWLSKSHGGTHLDWQPSQTAVATTMREENSPVLWTPIAICSSSGGSGSSAGLEDS